MAEADGPVLVGHAGERNPLTEVQIARKQSLVTLVTMNRTSRLLFHDVLELGDQPFVPFFVGGLVGEHNVPVAPLVQPGSQLATQGKFRPPQGREQLEPNVNTDRVTLSAVYNGEWPQKRLTGNFCLGAKR